MWSPAFLVAVLASLRLVGAGREEAAIEVFHPGHQAVHVTRLHRYEHDGYASFLQAEEEWKAMPEASPSFLSRPRRGRSTELERETPRESFVRVSEAQASALREHHALLQVAAKELSAANESASLRSDGEVFKYHGLVQPDSKHPGVTKLSNLQSQYIGQVGVGSVLAPSGCKPSSAESLLYIASDGDGKKDAETACHVKDQSQVWVVFDTGSTNIWISSVLCAPPQPCALPGRTRYDFKNSKSYVPVDGSPELEIEFGTGKINGPKGIDDFHIGPFTVQKQTFGMIRAVEGRVFEELAIEGIIGLAFPAMAANGIRPFVDGIIASKAIAKNEFAFYFSQNLKAGNAIFWGGVDKAFYKGEIEYFDVVEPYYWALEMAGFRIGDEELAHLLDDEDGQQEGGGAASPSSTKPKYKVLVDTGTTFFTAQGRLFGKIQQMLPPAPCKSIDKKSHPDITYTLVNSAGEKRDIVISNKQYMLSDETGDDSRCSSAFMKINVPREHGPGMVFGEVFLRIYFTVFDRGDGRDVKNARIGFALANHDEHTLKHLKALTKGSPDFQEQKQ
eukprot:TRINITY_DN31995_c0_g1_i1.p1 TRINITY_DN31995_c0_g1~~TRINITY_DN31995_c0_g1_i1.p1  ORF type:complete len:561 (-),score=119.13 TRINITY_DN31995_c0_g1_i1:9-1691(-)